MSTPLAPTIFFLSDYGHADEFVGVVHAVLHRLAPQAHVIDLTHGIAPFDKRGGAATLARAMPHLGPGIVLGVVDPGVGGTRRGVVIEVAPPDGGPTLFVGPDNGLLLPPLTHRSVTQRPGTQRSGTHRSVTQRSGTHSSVTRAVDLERNRNGTGRTFDGRDVFAPAAAALANGTDPATLGTSIDPTTLVRLPDPVVEHGSLPDERKVMRAEVTWVDRYGNVQLAARDFGGTEPDVLHIRAAANAEIKGSLIPVTRVATFSDLPIGASGILEDSSSHLTLVLREASFAARFADRLDLAAGAIVELVW